MASKISKIAQTIKAIAASSMRVTFSLKKKMLAPMVKIFHERMGDPGTEEGLALLKAASPLYKADKITKPLLIAQGANDPRVKQSESDQTRHISRQRLNWRGSCMRFWIMPLVARTSDSFRSSTKP